LGSLSLLAWSTAAVRGKDEDFVILPGTQSEIDARWLRYAGYLGARPTDVALVSTATLNTYYGMGDFWLPDSLDKGRRRIWLLEELSVLPELSPLNAEAVRVLTGASPLTPLVPELFRLIEELDKKFWEQFGKCLKLCVHEDLTNTYYITGESFAAVLSSPFLEKVLKTYTIDPSDEWCKAFSGKAIAPSVVEGSVLGDEMHGITGLEPGGKDLEPVFEAEGSVLCDDLHGITELRPCDYVPDAKAAAPLHDESLGSSASRLRIHVPPLSIGRMKPSDVLHLAAKRHKGELAVI
jgi:hypothetical protein